MPREPLAAPLRLRPHVVMHGEKRDYTERGKSSGPQHMYMYTAAVSLPKIGLQRSKHADKDACSTGSLSCAADPVLHCDGDVCERFDDA